MNKRIGEQNIKTSNKYAFKNKNSSNSEFVELQNYNNNSSE